jgi:transposase
LRYFCCDETANKTSVYTNISRNTINKIFDKIRQKIFLAHARQEEKSFGEFELDESYFGVKRVRGKKGRGTAGKTPVFRLLKRDGRVFMSR